MIRVIGYMALMTYITFWAVDEQANHPENVVRTLMFFIGGIVMSTTIFCIASDKEL